MKFIGKACNLLAYLACICLILLMLVTFIDVIGRYFFNRPMTFAVELVELLMGLVFFFGLGYATLRKSHVNVDILLGVLPSFVKFILQRLAALIAAVIVALMAWRLTIKAIGFAESGLATSVLFMPVAPFVFLMCVGAIFATIVAIQQLLVTDKDAVSIEGSDVSDSAPTDQR
ncbi:MAG: TRAP transporter small permease [Gammaproteobacteria bacterium]|nr:TRAP transporter small permease [Gammaproteobacteria bacterium]